MGTSPRKGLLCALCAVALAPQASGVAFPDPSTCAVYVAAGVDDVLATAYGICSTVADCSLSGLDEIACASDISSVLGTTFDLGMRISFATLVCGALDNVCASDIMGALTDFSKFATALIAAISDCGSDAAVCSYDVITAVDLMDFFITDVLGALVDCDQESWANGRYSFAAWLAWNDGIYSSRRLTEATAPAPAAAPALAAARGDELVGALPLPLEMAERLRAEVREGMGALSAVLEQRREAAAAAAGGRPAGSDLFASLHEAQRVVSAIATGMREAMQNAGFGAMLPPRPGSPASTARSFLVV